MSDEALHLINRAREQARSEGIKNFFGNNAKIITRLFLGIILFAIIFVGLRSYQKSNQEKYSTILHKSLINQQIGDLAKAKENLKEIVEAKSAPSGVKSLAALRYGAFLLEEGDKAGAAKTYQEVAECDSCDDYIRNLGALLTVKVWMVDEEEMKKEDLAARIEKIENDSDLLRYEIAEQRAFLELQKNNLEKSYQIFESISKAPESSQIMKTRAADGMQMVLSKGFEMKSAITSPEKN